MSDQPQQKMTGADLKLHHEAIKREVMRVLDRVLDDVKLRQWCVEQAVKIGSAPLPATAVEKDGGAIDDITIQIAKELTQYFYDFVTNAQEKPDGKSS